MRTKPERKRITSKSSSLNFTRGKKRKPKKNNKEKRKRRRKIRGVVIEKISLCTSSFGFIAAVETSRRGRQSIAIAYIARREKVERRLTIGRTRKSSREGEPDPRPRKRARARGPLARRTFAGKTEVVSHEPVLHMLNTLPDRGKREREFASKFF